MFLVLITFSDGQGAARVEPDRAVKNSEDFMFDVQPRAIELGQTVVLRWSIKGATRVLIEESTASVQRLRKIGTFSGSGNLVIRPKEDTVYVITCEGSTNYSCASASVRVRVTRH
jgi:hypothetical protein